MLTKKYLHAHPLLLSSKQCNFSTKRQYNSGRRLSLPPLSETTSSSSVASNSGNESDSTASISFSSQNGNSENEISTNNINQSIRKNTSSSLIYSKNNNNQNFYDETFEEKTGNCNDIILSEQTKQNDNKSLNYNLPPASNQVSRQLLNLHPSSDESNEKESTKSSRTLNGAIIPNVINMKKKLIRKRNQLPLILHSSSLQDSRKVDRNGQKINCSNVCTEFTSSTSRSFDESMVNGCDQIIPVETINRKSDSSLDNFMINVQNHNRNNVTNNINSNNNKNNDEKNENRLPLADMNVPSFSSFIGIRQCSSNEGGNLFFIDQNLPLLPTSISDPLFDDIFIKKMKICKQICTFDIENSNLYSYLKIDETDDCMKSSKVLISSYISLPSASMKKNNQCNITNKTSKQMTLKELTKPEKSEESLNGKMIKHKATQLNDVLRMITTASRIDKMPPICSDMLYEMLNINLCRKFPRITEMDLFLEQFPPIQEPAWEHVSICYKILKKIVLEFHKFPKSNYPLKKCIIHNMRSPDPNERKEIVDIMTCFLKDQKKALKYLMRFTKKLHKCTEVKRNPYQIDSICNLLVMIFRVLGPNNLTVQKVFVSSIIPLLHHGSFAFFSTSVENMIRIMIAEKIISNSTNYVKKEEILNKNTNINNCNYNNNIVFHNENDQNTVYAKLIVTNLIKYWPLKQSNKQVVFLRLLLYTYPICSKTEKEELFARTFGLFASSTASQNEKVAKTALSLWKKESFDLIIKEKRAKVLGFLLNPVKFAANNHWSMVVRTIASSVFINMMKSDSLKNLKESDKFAAEKKTWVMITRNAAQTYRNSTDISAKTNEILLKFNNKLGYQI